MLGDGGGESAPATNSGSEDEDRDFRTVVY